MKVPRALLALAVVTGLAGTFLAARPSSAGTAPAGAVTPPCPKAGTAPMPIACTPRQ